MTYITQEQVPVKLGEVAISTNDPGIIYSLFTTPNAHNQVRNPSIILMMATPWMVGLAHTPYTAENNGYLHVLGILVDQFREYFPLKGMILVPAVIDSDQIPVDLSDLTHILASSCANALFDFVSYDPRYVTPNDKASINLTPDNRVFFTFGSQGGEFGFPRA